MQYNRVVQLASGTCIKIDNTLSSKIRSIDFELEKGKKYEDHFSVFNGREQELDGNAYSDNNRVTIKTKIISGKVCDVTFTIDATSLSDGSIILGKIFVITNVGMLQVPFKYTIVANRIDKAISELNSIADYYDCLNDDFDFARSLFSNSNFIKAPFMQNEFNLCLYEGLCKGSNINIAIIEFFKAFDLDVSKQFLTLDDKIVKKYIDETLDNLDLNSIRDSKPLVDAITYGADDGKNAKDDINDDILDESKTLIDIMQDKELLNVLASMCVRNNYTNEIAFRLYLRVVEKGSSISGIYEKFLHSIPENYSYKLPLYIYRYYFDDTSYSFDDKAHLYENIISAFEDTENVYKMFSDEILEYAISRIYQNRITESLTKIYDKILSVNIVNENNCNNILYLLRSYKIIVHNRSIRRIVIRYSETEKETKYDVVNGIVYIPIFFESYIIFFEDIYGNRFYSEDAEISALFNKKEIEKYIIDNYPPKDIIEMTKLIKLNETVNITREYEVDEIRDLEAKIRINKVIRDKIQDKIIDYYFNRNLTSEPLDEMSKTYLKKMPFEQLSFEHKKKLLKVLIDSQEYLFVYDKVSTFGLELMDGSDLLILFSKCIDINDEVNKDKLLNDIFQFVKSGHRDPKLCNYLSNQYIGSVENMVVILDALNELNIDSNYIAKKILMNILECNDSTYLDHVYNSYSASEYDEINLQVAYFNKKATDYFLDDIETDDEYFIKLSEYMGEHYNNIDKDMPIIFLFAITKYISTIKVLNNNEYRRLLIKSMDRLLNTEYVFAYYKKLNRHMKMPYSIMNKEYIEYHANKDFVPKAILSISGSGEKKEIELNKMFMNIYVKKITVFKNEVINYDIINGSDLSSGILASGTLVYDEIYELEYPKSNKVKSMFDYINDAIVCLDRENMDGLKRVIIEMTEKQEISKELFEI